MACAQSSRCNGTERQKLIHSIYIYMLFLVIGWIRGLFGPSFIDLLLISDVTLKIGSWIPTLAFIGYAIGCVAGGLLYDKISRNLMYATGVLLVGILTAGIPWCFIFALMAAAHFFQGLALGVADTVGNAEMISLWRENKMMFFIIEFCYSLGVFVAPLVVAPFLSDVATSEYRGNDTTSHNVTFKSNLQTLSPMTTIPTNIQLVVGRGSDDNSTYGNLTQYTESHATVSRLFVPFSISAALAVLVSLPFFIKYFMGNVQNSDDNSTQIDGESNEMKKVEETRPRVLPTKLKVLCLLLISSMMFLGLSLCESSVSFIAVYCVDEIGFSPADGALVNAVSSACGIGAIAVAMFASRLNTLVFLGIHTVGSIVGLLGLLLSSLGQINIGIWISSAVVGYFRSMIFSLIFTWTNTYITPTTGKISSLFMMCSCSGAAVGPLLLGWLMEEYSNLWFCYLLLVFGVVLLLLYIIGMVLTKYVTTVYGKTFEKTVEEDISLRERLNKEENGVDGK
ncbi:sodium-dependent glucose transporter 1-like [Pecten maximus]|uniref:sodium-dependent glucose transporter 1-like n=1 Tax=Pecten maximus TaxID=6579 RepID=UPI001458030D|nr:sodium-dependent glucose transporter 1-like [Pecten maximus]